MWSIRSNGQSVQREARFVASRLAEAWTRTLRAENPRHAGAAYDMELIISEVISTILINLCEEALVLHAQDAHTDELSATTLSEETRGRIPKKRWGGARLIVKDMVVSALGLYSRLRFHRVRIDSGKTTCVLAFAAHPNHIRALAPIVHALNQERISAKLVIQQITFINRRGFAKLSKLRQLLDSSSGGRIDWIPWELYTRLLVPQANSLSLDRIDSFVAQAKSDEVLAYFDRSVLAHIGQEIIRYFTDSLPLYERYMGALYRLSDTYQPRLLLSPYRVGWLPFMVQRVATRIGGSTLIIQHGELEGVWIKPVGDHIAVWGEAGKRACLEQGFKEENVTVVGCSFLDSVLSTKGQEQFRSKREELRRAWGVGANEQVLVYMTQPVVTRGSILSAQEKRIVAQDLALFARRAPSVLVVLKLHPDDDGVIEKLAFSEMGVDYKLARGLTAQEVLAASDMVFTLFSTAGLEALAMGLPVISHTHIGFAKQVPFINSGLVHLVSSAEQLGNLFTALRERRTPSSPCGERERARKLEELLYRLDGKAVERVVALCRRLLNGG